MVLPRDNKTSDATLARCFVISEDFLSPPISASREELLSLIQNTNVMLRASLALYANPSKNILAEKSCLISLGELLTGFISCSYNTGVR